jgi:hypothetical protein
MPEDLFSGASTAATGSVSSNTASLLSFSSGMKHVIINNNSGQTAYFKLNDADTPTVSATVYDVSLKDGEKFAADYAVVTNVSVYVTATSGIRVVGWK